MNLRFIIRDGKKILQYETKEYEGAPYYDALGRRKQNTYSVWVDIPVCDEDTGEEIGE
jgi:hypothetical protein